ncbi:hypothetical protein L596_028945 [Steinernema carpocapsae]|uniref:Uncharacterized protein n=1 Tax=Steinernema carpocapsae TaxID=34508 RepID=A0A4V5ZY14_STECR|nr:hypothetical protein L596_028945 [Steinernema carpocapsae]
MSRFRGKFPKRSREVCQTLNPRIQQNCSSMLQDYGYVQEQLTNMVLRPYATESLAYMLAGLKKTLALTKRFKI